MPSESRPKKLGQESICILPLFFKKIKQGPEMVNFGASKLGVGGPRS